MTHAQIISGSPVALNPASAVTFERDGQTINASYQTMMLWSDDEKATIGIYPILEDAIPEGKIGVNSILENVDGVVYRRWTLEDAPVQEILINKTQFTEALNAVEELTTDVEELWNTATGAPN